MMTRALAIVAIILGIVTLGIWSGQIDVQKSIDGGHTFTTIINR